MIDFCSARTALRSCLPLAVAITIAAASARALTPEQSIAAMQLDPRFTISVFAAEPDIVDPVAVAFDERGRAFVCEMREMEMLPALTPGTKATIRLIEDTDNDGRADRSTLFAEGLSFPSGIAVFEGGVFALCTPDLLYLKDTDGDGKADVRRVVRTGFAQGNAEHRFNNLTWNFDNWIYAANGGGGGTLTDPADTSRPPLDLGGSDFALDPWSGHAVSLSRQTGGGFGLAFDNWGRRFVCDNEHHCTMILLPQRYFGREKSLPLSAASRDITEDPSPDDPVFPISKPQDWRIERTDRRARLEADHFRPTQLKANGYFTAACGSMVYRGGLFPRECDGNLFVCDAAQNLVHRAELIESGTAMIARRADEGIEFLRSTEITFRPVNLTTGPDGALYVIDFHRDIIETGASIPADILAKLDLRAGSDMGRIFRIVPRDAKPLEGPTRLADLSDADLIAQLDAANAWRRLTAQRLLIERRSTTVPDALKKLAAQDERPLAKLHALWTLRGLKSLDEDLIAAALQSPHAKIREQALILAEAELEPSLDAPASP